MDEMELLREYSASKSEGAFGELARRYVNLVYSAAFRMTGNSAAAEDVTQAVFLVLARKAHRLREDVVLSSWLLTATRYAARDAMKAESRRTRHEQRAAGMKPIATESAEAVGDGADWSAVAPLLDDAVASLKDGVRPAILLRYFERKSYAEIAGQMRITEVAARQRVSRALEQLRAYFSGRGIVLSAASLKVLVAANATLPAPVATGGAAASMGATGVGVTARHAAMAQAVSMGMIPMGIKLAAVAVVVVVIGAGAMLAMHLVGRGSCEASAAVKVDKMDGIGGAVLTADGKPVVGAEVLLARSGAPVEAYGAQQSGALAVRTGADGLFELPNKSDALAVVVRADEGYAQARVEDLRRAAGRIVLTPWARIEGTLRAGGELQSFATVDLFRAGGSLQEWNQWHVIHEARTRTDALGRFVFGRVIPATKDYSHGPGIKWTPNNKPDEARTYGVRVEPGETARVTLGGDGTTVVGRINVGGKFLPPFHGVLSRILDLPEPATEPVARPATQAAARATTRKAFRRTGSPVGEPFRFTAADDGTFRVIDVPPGEYDLQFRSWVEPAGNSVRRDVAWVHARVVVPEVTGSLVRSPVDVGVLEANLIQVH